VTEWLLIETFGDGSEPTLLAVGSSPRKRLPLNRLLRRSRDVDEIRALLARVVQSRQPVHTTSADGQRALIGVPLCGFDGRAEPEDGWELFDGRVHAVFVWRGPWSDTPPARNPAGAWTINLTRGLSARSDELLALYWVAPGNRKHVHSISELFAQPLHPGNDEASAIAKLVRAQPGDQHFATWTITRDDGVTRAANFAYTAFAVPNKAGEIEVIERGITHDIGPADAVPAAPAPTPMLLAERVVAAQQTPGQWRLIYDLQQQHMIKWIDPPMPGIAWQYGEQHEPEIHPDDGVIYCRMYAALPTGTVNGKLRFRTTDGGWMRMAVTATMMVLDQHTTAALVTLSQPESPTTG
jgi:hypothetical protein